MEYKKIIFSGHAICQMFQRMIRNDDVSAVIRNGEVIADYPDDKPNQVVYCLVLLEIGPCMLFWQWIMKIKRALL